MRLADTPAAQRAGLRMADTLGDIRGALDSLGIPGLDLEAVDEWAAVAIAGTRRVAHDPDAFRGRFVGSVAAAIILGIELERSRSRQP